jgi:hypothetical protein
MANCLVGNLFVYFLAEAIATVTASKAPKELEQDFGVRYVVVIVLGIALVVAGYAIKRKSVHRSVPSQQGARSQLFRCF